MMEEMAKSLPVSKRMVYNSYLKVSAKRGGAGIDEESIEMFSHQGYVWQEEVLYNIWNCCESSGKEKYTKQVERDTTGEMESYSAGMVCSKAESQNPGVG